MCTKLPLEQCSTTTPEYTPAQSRLLDVALGALADHKVLGTNFNGGRVKPDGLIKRVSRVAYLSRNETNNTHLEYISILEGRKILPHFLLHDCRSHIGFAGSAEQRPRPVTPMGCH